SLPVELCFGYGLFAGTRRVLDAFVKRHAGDVLRWLEATPLMRAHAIYVPFNLRAGGQERTLRSGRDLLSLLPCQGKHLVHVCGEGGAGKSSVCCQIMRWALAADRNAALYEHPTIPILFDEPLLEGNGDANETLVAASQRRMEDMLGRGISRKLTLRL